MTIKGLPDTLLKIVWIAFLLLVMNPIVRVSIQTLKILMEKSHVDELYVMFFFMIIGSLGIRATSLLKLD